ncbi:hypothetical protein BCV72DRAFT_220943 [Rhizopus microsporus var. microsporus]|uniref:Uncharacterized protein n=2 Tax=Rhizopus microsporus TaxID=58291 RepID=A0A2G4SK91_RHIZD|nr:uncharacterized protein RHIMIDRAFT_264307 [Rhizopus microsporus ATCC 52813]ORE10783.1 hypothetical protein BCV72DRAFT_220943 [Rhizopus microsporus var. microsporus]PHZ09189.1 hypothetical protein RHIMIDRAFT_264307 [Rhizopus microsporus ATCC 52813]
MSFFDNVTSAFETCYRGFQFTFDTIASALNFCRRGFWFAHEIIKKNNNLKSIIVIVMYIVCFLSKLRYPGLV